MQLKKVSEVILKFVIAGWDTTETTLSRAIYMLIRHAHVADKLYLQLKTFEVNRAKKDTDLASMLLRVPCMQS